MRAAGEYTQKLLSLFGGAAGQVCELDMREFNDDLEAHDDEMQDRYWAEMLVSYQAVVSQATRLWGEPEVRIRQGDDLAHQWMDRVHATFVELAAWPRDDGTHLFILIDHEDRELPMLLTAGVTRSRVSSDP